MRWFLGLLIFIAVVVLSSCSSQKSSIRALRADQYVFMYNNNRVELTNFRNVEVKMFLSIEYSSPQEIHNVVYSVLPEQTRVLIGKRIIIRLDIEVCEVGSAPTCTNYSL